MTKLRRIALVLPFALWAAFAAAQPVDINQADAAQIAQAMKGVGQSRAEAIIQFREQHGPFRRIEDLIKVRGIGEKLVEANRANITVTEPK